MILLDTDTLTHFAFGSANVLRGVEEAGAEEIAVPIITSHEVVRGRVENLLKAATEEELRIAAERLRQAEEVLAAFEVVGFDHESVKQFGRSRKRKNLNKMGRADMPIACIALAHDALLVTRNVRDYKDVTGLRTANWVD